MENNQFFESNQYDTFTVKLMWTIRQDFVCGSLEKVVEYALEKGVRGIECFYRVDGFNFIKMTKKELKQLLKPELSEKLFKKY